MKKSLCVMESVLFVALWFMPAIFSTIAFAQTDKTPQKISSTRGTHQRGHQKNRPRRKNRYQESRERIGGENARAQIRSPTRPSRRRLVSLDRSE